MLLCKTKSLSFILSSSCFNRSSPHVFETSDLSSPSTILAKGSSNKFIPWGQGADDFLLLSSEWNRLSGDLLKYISFFFSSSPFSLTCCHFLSRSKSLNIALLFIDAVASRTCKPSSVSRLNSSISLSANWSVCNFSEEKLFDFSISSSIADTFISNREARWFGE